MSDSPRRDGPLLALHKRVLAGDAAALDDLVRRLVAELPRRVRGVVDKRAVHLVDPAVDHAVMVYVAAPRAYDPDLGSVLAWLRTVVANKVREWMRQDRRRACREVARGVDLDLAPLASPAPDTEDARRREAWLLARERT